eukprot:2426169-Karenia_brevis.AAC.1
MLPLRRLRVAIMAPAALPKLPCCRCFFVIVAAAAARCARVADATAAVAVVGTAAVFNMSHRRRVVAATFVV